MSAYRYGVVLVTSSEQLKPKFTCVENETQLMPAVKLLSRPRTASVFIDFGSQTRTCALYNHHFALVSFTQTQRTTKRAEKLIKWQTIFHRKHLRSVHTTGRRCAPLTTVSDSCNYWCPLRCAARKLVSQFISMECSKLKKVSFAAKKINFFRTFNYIYACIGTNAFPVCLVIYFRNFVHQFFYMDSKQ